MKKLLYIIGVAATLCCSAPAGAGVVERADTAYINDDFATAAALYEQAIDSLGPSAERYYNLGNAYFRLERPGMAVVNYERALRLDPTNTDVRENLEFVNSRLTDRIDASDSFVGDSLDSAARSLNPDSWAIMAIVAFVLALAGVALYFFSTSVLMRKVGFFGAGVLVIVTIAGAGLARRSANLATAGDRAVIIKPSVILSTTPRQPKDRSEEAFLLHEGTQVTLLDSISEPADTTGRRKWYDAKVDGAHRAWIPSDAIERI